MQFHTDLTQSAITWIRQHCGVKELHFERCDERGSKSHARAFDILLAGSGGRNNTGRYGAGDYNGATWDEWGAFIGMVYAFDPNARLGGTVKSPVYANAKDFHEKTGGRFIPVGVPKDTHSRHRWVFDGTDGETWSYTCGKEGCSATRYFTRTYAAA